MIRKAFFTVILVGILGAIDSIQLYAQTCPDLKIDSSAMNQSYLEIQSLKGNFQISLPKIMVFPEGKERIYCLLPDILTNHNTPIIQWNELVLKKGLNSTDKWQGNIDRAEFFPTLCLPSLKPANFTNATSATDFYYDTQSNLVSMKGSIAFANVDGNKIILHLNIENQEIPKPKINNLSGKIITSNGELEVISGEISFEENKGILRGSVIASSNVGNQGFQFSIPKYKGQPGKFVVNEGSEKQPLFNVYKIEGIPTIGLEIHRYELQESDLNFKSFFDKYPFDIDSLDLNRLHLKSILSSNSIAIDPKPMPEIVPLFNTASNEANFGMETSNSIKSPSTWKENLTVKFRSEPIWQFQIEELTEEFKPNKLVIKNVVSSDFEGKGNKLGLNMDQVNAINEGFTKIFKSFDEDSDTLGLKKAVLQLFSDNNLPSTASIQDDFEAFLITTVTEFRNQEKVAMGKIQSSTDTTKFNRIKKSSYALLLDEKALFPLLRQYEINNTKIQIHYGDTITLIANNPLQGEQQLSIPTNARLYDIYQFYGILKLLPISLGFETNLKFFDLSVQSQKLITNTEQTERQLIIPDFIHASIKVVEEVILENHPAFKINVKFQGLKNNLFIESFHGENSGIYYLSKSQPHQIIKATFEEGIVLE